jgi:RHS repeat-associated protein
MRMKTIINQLHSCAKGWALTGLFCIASASVFGQLNTPANVQSPAKVNQTQGPLSSTGVNDTEAEIVSPGTNPVNTGCFTTPAPLSPNLPNSTTAPIPTGTNLPPNAIPGPVSYIRTYTALQPNLVNNFTINTQPVQMVQTQTKYVDGLGQPIQVVVKEAAPGYQDIVQPFQYDNLGREARTFLPFSASQATGTDKNGSRYYHDAIRQQRQFYLNAADMPHSDYPYSQKTFEPSPLNRVLSEAAPGEAWVGANRKTEFASRTNTAADNVRRYTVGSGLDNTIVLNGFYAAGELFISETKNEHGKRVLEFKDRDGKMIVRKTETDNASFLQTYYLYDDLGNLRVVLPPKAVSTQNNASYNPIAEPYLFRYNYDSRQRMIIKKVPGGGETHMVYDKQDRLILSQDAKQRSKNKWSFIKYDPFSRPVITGIIQSMNTRANFELLATQAIVLSEGRISGGIHNYTNNALPTITGNHALTVTYYDDYDFNRDGKPDMVYDDKYNPKFSNPAVAPTPFYQLKGQVTATKVYVPANGTFYWTYNFYDDKYNLIQTIRQHRLGDDRTVTAYTFTGKPLQTFLKHTNTVFPLNSYTVQRYYEYDPADRLKMVDQLINDAYASTIVYNDYNPLGDKLSGKSVGSIQYIKYDYNIRGWLTRINNPDNVNFSTLFGMAINYENGFTNARYDGCISGITWRNSQDNTYRAYGFQYDSNKRLTQANYRYKTTQAGLWDRKTEDYTVSGLSYDENGNIITLNRSGLLNATDRTIGKIDELGYRYSGNRLIGVDDKVPTKTATVSFQDNGQIFCNTATDEYGYDENGNLIFDRNKGITNISYNHQNLPELIEFGSDKIAFVYDATGTKIRKEISGSLPGKIYDYIGDAVYENDMISFIQTPEGRALYNRQKNTWEYEYDYKDHLGNTRLTYKQEWYDYVELTSEETNAEKEEATYERVAPSRHLDKQHSRTGEFAVWLNAEKKKVIGPGKVFKVHKGDSISVNVFGHYEKKPQGHFLTKMATVLGTALIPNQVGEFSKGKAVYPHLSLGMALAPVVAAKDGKTPKAYLRYIVLDKDSNYVTDGVKFLNERANESWQELSLKYGATQDGYLEIYLANESGTDVWFDDMRSGQYNTVIKQVNHYDPWGLNLNDIELKGNPENKFQYNGKEKQEEYGLNWNDFGARFYDPQLGRWHVLDPMADDRNWVSPYNYVQNNPMMRIDPDGALDGDFYNTEGNYLGNDGKNDDKVYVVEGTSRFNMADFEEGGKYSENKEAFNENNGDGYSVNDKGTVSEAFKTWDSVTNDRIGELHPAIRMQATNFINQVEEDKGINLRIADGIRSIEEQNDNYAKGRTKSGKIVTQAKGGFSYHNYGLAIDIVEIKNNKANYKIDFKNVSEIGKKNGFQWGGDWHKPDRVHFQNSFGQAPMTLLNLVKSGKTSSDGYVKIR